MDIKQKKFSNIHQQDLKSLNTLNLESKTESFVDISKQEDLDQLIRFINYFSRIIFLGSGSNIVFKDNVKGLVIKMNMKGIKIHFECRDYTIIEASAGELWQDVVFWCMSNGFYGLENLALIPGTIGAAPIQNIGAYGAELCDYFYSLSALDIYSNQILDFDKKNCKFSYRDSIFKHKNYIGKFLITSVKLIIKKQWNPNLKHNNLHIFKNNINNVSPWDIYYHVCNIRMAKLPDYKIYGNVGSFFKNPIISHKKYMKIISKFPNLICYPYENKFKISAGCLIEKCGWLGKSIGKAAVDEKHALIIINLGGAKARDIICLASDIKNDVLYKTGILLEQEPSYF